MSREVLAFTEQFCSRLESTGFREIVVTADHTCGHGRHSQTRDPWSSGFKPRPKRSRRTPSSVRDFNSGR
jgi:hypothetical protein